MDNSPNTIPRFWKGYISGTNRGSLTVCLNRQGETLEGQAIVADQEVGSTIVGFSGILAGQQANLNLIRFFGFAPVMALYGTLTLNFGNNFESAEGTWQTEIGTQGACKLWRSEKWSISWQLSLMANKLCVYFRRHGALIYVSFLTIVGGLALFQKVEISYPALVLLLVPAPYIFRRHLGELIQAYQVRKIGPVELGAQHPLPQEALRVIIEQQIQTTVHQQVREAVTFLALDGFFVLRTKLILIWLRQMQAVERAQFNAYATATGVAADNLDATWSALPVSGCAILAEGRLTITDLGRRYVAHLTRQN